MNKMDINMAEQAETEVKSPGFRLPPWVRKVAVFAAPALMIAAGVVAYALLDMTGPKPEEKTGDAHPVAVQFAVAEARPTTISVNVQGEARPRVDAALAAQVAGRIVSTRATVQPGSVTFLQRFGGSLNLNLHYHVIFLEGVFVDRAAQGLKPRFRPATLPTDADIVTVLHKKILRHLKLAVDPPPIAPARQAAFAWEC
jgi:hypothetical protein